MLNRQSISASSVELSVCWLIHIFIMTSAGRADGAGGNAVTNGRRIDGRWNGAAGAVGTLFLLSVVDDDGEG